MATTTIIRQVTKGRGRHYVVEGVPELEGVKLPSVTTILNVISKPALIPWAKRISLEKAKAELYGYLGSEAMLMTTADVDTLIEAASKRPDQVRDEAGDFGTRAHQLIQDWLERDRDVPFAPPDSDLDIAPVLDAFLDWYKGSGLLIQVAESRVYSLAHRYAGTMDAMAYRGGKRVILDWKTSSGLYPEMALQVAAYAKAYEEMSGLAVDEAWVIRFAKKPDAKPLFEVREVDIEAGYRGFLAAQTLWQTLRDPLWEVAI
jgi:hypothetical protein